MPSGQPAGAGVRSRLHRPGCFRLLVGMIAGTHQRSGLDMAETTAQRFLFQIDELIRRVEAGNREMIA